MFVIYNVNTWKLLRDRNRNDMRFNEERHAKAAFTRACRKEDFQPDEWKIDTMENYRAAEPMVETYNMLNREAGPIMIKASMLGTCCDPATETYHSM